MDLEHMQKQGPVEKTIPQEPRKSYLILWLFAFLLSNVTTYILASKSSPWRNRQVSEPLQIQPSRHGPIDTTERLVEFTALRFVPNEFQAEAGNDVDVDAAWSSIGANYDRFFVSREEATDFRELTTDHVFLTPDSVTGVDLDRAGYPVFMEVHHQLHCLNLIRQGLYWNYEYYQNQADGMWTNKLMIQNHIQHCHDYLRLVVMCHSEIGLIPFFWRNQSTIMLDYKQQKQCRNFESVQTWAELHSVNMNDGDVEYMAPMGAKLTALGSKHM